MEQQSRYIAELRNEIYTLKGQTSAEAHIQQKNIAQFEDNCKKAIDQSNAKLENSMMLRDKHHRELSDNIAQMFQQLARTQLATVDTTLKDNLWKICTHKAFVELMSNAILSGMQKSLEQTFRKMLEDVMIPSYNKISQEMFQEISRSFTVGTKEYTRAFETYMKQYSAMQFQMADFENAIHQIPQHVKQNTEQSLIPILNAGFTDMRQRLEKTQVKMLGDLKEHVKLEISSGFERQASALEDSVLSVVQRSQAETPAPTIYDQQENIKQLLQHGQIDKAFHVTLHSSDLAMLEYTLEKADFKKVFNPCPLQQTVLLSLIQQLTADMSKYNEIKNR